MNLVIKRWKDIKKQEDVRQIHEAFNRVITLWYDYKPLKQVTNKTTKQSNIPFGPG